MTNQRSPVAPPVRAMLNKVPEVTLYFWVIKILCTTVGQTFAEVDQTERAEARQELEPLDDPEDDGVRV